MTDKNTQFIKDHGTEEMKRVRAILEDCLPEDEYQKAISGIVREYKKDNSDFDLFFPTWFLWRETEEKPLYWGDIFYKIITYEK